MAAVIYQLLGGAYRMERYPNIPPRKDIAVIVIIADGNKWETIEAIWTPIPKPKRKILTNTDNIFNTHDGIYGIAKYLSGDVRNIRGFVGRLWGQVSPNLIGDVSTLRGDLSNIWGNVPERNIWGDVSGLKGNISRYSGDVTGQT